uniref:Kappa-type opioid receptor n=1 Tax=Phallusia mammillata TaxID=59560 RepID=A0A6F9DN61_9ASCI|nr:kappa-type opioid receptor [Phallusia mammillata]
MLKNAKIKHVMTSLLLPMLLLSISSSAFGQPSNFPDLDEFQFEDAEYGENPLEADHGGLEELEKSLDQKIGEMTSSRRYVISLVYFVIAVAGAVMNVVALVVSQRCSSLQYSQRLFMQNLCISCLLLILSKGFSAQYRLLETWMLGSIMCKLVNCVKALAIFAQAYFTVTLCADYVILRKRPRITDITRTILEIAAVVFGWVFSLAFAAPMLVFSEVENLGKINTCELVFQLPLPDQKEDHYEQSDSFPEDDMEYYDYELEHYPLPEIPFQAEVQEHVIECKDADNPPYMTWLIVTFVATFLLPLLAVFVLWILNKVLMTPHSVLVPQNAYSEPTAVRHRNSSRNNKRQMRPCMPAGVWVALICAVCFVCYAPFYAYHVGRIPGLPLGLKSCANFRDYSFVQGYFTCILLPALVVAYSRPIGIQSCSRALTTSSTSSFASSSSSKRKSTSSGESQTPDGTESGPYQAPLLTAEKPQQTSVL